VGRQARRADPLEPAAHQDGVVLLAQLAAEVDRHPREHEIPERAVPAERGLEPLVAALLEVGRVDGVVDVSVGVGDVYGSNTID